MARRLPLVLLFVSLCLGWYFLVGFIDRGALIHNSPAISTPCLSEYLPRGTIHIPEGAPIPPRGDYVFIPLGLECSFIMLDGSTQRSFHPHYAQTTIALLPAFAVLVWGVVKVASFRRGEKCDGASGGTVSVPPRTYRVSVDYINLGSVDAEEITGDDQLRSHAQHSRSAAATTQYIFHPILGRHP
jgi:hypothetical protein